MLTNLTIVDASTNQINTFPSLPTSVATLYLDNNSLTTIPNLLAYTALSKVRLYMNYLSFEDLLPLTNNPNYSAIYSVAPQNKIRVGTNQTVVEHTSFSIDSNLDSNIPTVIRKWYFENTATNQSNLLYQINKTQLSDQGAYYCSLTDPSFPGLTIQTENFNITVLPCVNINGVTTEIQGSTCIKQGSVYVTLTAQPSSNYTFQLEGVQSHKIFTSTSGQFASLADPQYILTIIAPTGCTYTLPTISIPREECQQIVLTPNGDGVDDTYYFPQTGSAKLVDKFGNVACQLSLPKIWDGYCNGQKLPVGYYLVTINGGEEVLKVSIIF